MKIKGLWIYFYKIKQQKTKITIHLECATYAKVAMLQIIYLWFYDECIQCYEKIIVNDGKISCVSCKVGVLNRRIKAHWPKLT